MTVTNEKIDARTPRHRRSALAAEQRRGWRRADQEADGDDPEQDENDVLGAHPEGRGPSRPEHQGGRQPGGRAERGEVEQTWEVHGGFRRPAIRPRRGRADVGSSRWLQAASHPAALTGARSSRRGKVTVTSAGLAGRRAALGGRERRAPAHPIHSSGSSSRLWHLPLDEDPVPDRQLHQPPDRPARVAAHLLLAHERATPSGMNQRRIIGWRDRRAPSLSRNSPRNHWRTGT